LRRLLDNGIDAWPAIMYETSGSEGIENLKELLRKFGIRPEGLELEHLESYPFVLENLRKRSIPLYN
jgi:uncharacterized Fe-S cluster-containing radical SAM superfamily protein